MRIRNLVALLLLCLATGTLGAPPVQAGAAGTFLSLPYTTTDVAGNQWMIYQNGMLQQRGNQPVYAQGAMLLINGEALQAASNRVHIDDDTGELVLDNLSAAGMTVTRRVLIKANDAYVRYIDVIKNATPADQTLDVQLQSRVNFQLIASQTVPDPHNKDRVLAWVGQTQVNRAAVELLNGRSSDNAFSIAAQQDANLVQADLSVKVPAGKEVAVMHVHSTAASADAGMQLVAGWQESKLLKNVRPEIGRILINFNSGISLIGDAQVLRGDLLDVVELRGGDQLKGTLKEPTYTLHTFYGEIQLPADALIGLINIGKYRPRQLLVSGDGQVFGGQLAKETISLELSSGQLTQIPLSQIARIGYRRRPGESADTAADQTAEQSADQSIVLLRTGDRMAVLPPEGTIDFLTRYGLLKLDPKAIGAIAFQSDDNAVHTAYLTDGSHFAGLVASEEFKMKLRGTRPAQVEGADNGAATTQPLASEQTITIPAAALFRWQLSCKTAEPGDDSPALRLANGDLFVGSLAGELKLDTLFDTITINAGEIHSLTHTPDAGSDVQIELWDQTRLSGSLRDEKLTCALSSGQAVNVPVALIESYSQPQPQPSDGMVQQIKLVVANLSADDWKQRDQAQNQLTAMGPMIAVVLKQLLPSQPPEAQQRLEAVLKQFADKKSSGGAASVTGGG